MKNKIYIAKYSTGRYEIYTEHIVFAPTNKSKVTKWCTKFNKMIIKWSDYYKKYEDDIGWIKAQYRDWEDRKSTRLNSSHSAKSRMPSSA